MGKRERNREVIFLTKEEHEELCLYHQTIFGQDGLETGKSRAPLRVLWAEMLHRIALGLSQALRVLQASHGRC